MSESCELTYEKILIGTFMEAFFAPTIVKSPSGEYVLTGLGKLLTHWMELDGNRCIMHRNRGFLLRASP